MVVDNNSCREVRDYLEELRDTGDIDILILNARNIGYINGLLQVLHSAPGEFVFHTDSDIYFKPGWMKAHLDIMENYPNVGLVGGIPIRNLSQYRTVSTLAWANEHAEDVSFEQGDLIPRKWLLEYYHSLGVFSEQWLNEFMSYPDYRLKFNDVGAFIGASHMQFLTRKSAINELPLGLDIEIAMASPESVLDQVLDEKGYLRLSTTSPYVYHLGNLLSEDWAIAEYQELVGDSGHQFQNPANVPPKQQFNKKKHWFWGRTRVRKILQRLYEWAYDMFWKYAG